MKIINLFILFVLMTFGQANAQRLSGSGTTQDPYLINSNADWNTFAQSVTNGSTYTGQTVQLNTNITVTTMAGVENKCFAGIFDGKGHTITLDMTASMQFTSLFCYADGATFQNLKVDGTINTTKKFCAGIVGAVVYNGCTFINCVSEVTINSSINGDGTHGGFVAYAAWGDNTFEGCAFTGKLLGANTTNVGGFVGFTETNREATVSFTNCVFHPEQVTMSGNGCQTFARWRSGNNSVIIGDNCYYSQTLGAAQGKLMHSITGGEYVTVAFSGNANTYNVSGISTYGVGMSLPSTAEEGAGERLLCAGEGETVSLNLSCTPPSNYGCFGFTTVNGTLTGTANPYTLTMPDEPVTIQAVLEQLPPVAYLDENGEEQECASYTLVTNNLGFDNLSAGWYVVKNDIYINSSINFTGDVHLILCDNATLNINCLDDALVVDGSLTLYVQSEGTGSLTANSNGGNGMVVFENLTINGGTVTADGYYGDGILATNLTINGGTVTTEEIFSPMVTLGWSNITDHITVGSFTYNITPTVSVKSDQVLQYENNGEMVTISGTLNENQINAIGGKTLYPSLPAVAYIDENGVEQQCTFYTVVTDELNFDNLPGGWYVVNEDISINGSIHFTSDVNLILCDNATMNINVVYSDALYTDGSLTLYGQSEGTGSLNATSVNDIGIRTIILVINGIHVTATGGNRGIFANDLTINGGTVTAMGNCGIFSSNVFLGWSNTNDSITVSSIASYYTPSVSVKSGQAFYYISYDSGEKQMMDTVIISGMLTAWEIEALAGKTLMPYIEPCTPPSDLEVTGINATSATLQWTGVSEMYNVNYYKQCFYDSFEEDLSAWTIYHEGDGASWEWGVESPHDNSADLNAHSGYYAAVSYSGYDVHADSWLISPQIRFPNHTMLKFWITCPGYDNVLDEYEVLLSTTGNAISDFSTVLKEKEAANTTWTEVSIDLSEYDGQSVYIAIRHDYTGGSFIMVDDFAILGWFEEMLTPENHLFIYDLQPLTEYHWHVQGLNCDGEGSGTEWSDTATFTTSSSCWPIHSLSIDNLTSFSVNLSWILGDETQTDWQICLNDDENNLITANTNEGFLLDGLTPNVEYTVKVRSYCGENDYGNWSDTINFTTPEVCATPKDLTVSNITTVSADLNWIGKEDVESYTVRYRSAEGMVVHFLEDFSDNIDRWTLVDCVSRTGLDNGAFAFYRVTDANTPNPNQYLISPDLTGSVTNNSVLEFKYRIYACGYPETFMVGFSSTDNEIGSFSWSDPITVSTNVWNTYDASLPASTKYIAIQCPSVRKYHLFIDDIIIGNEAIAGQWMTNITTETEAHLINLNAGTMYEAQVRSDCNPDGWCDKITFKTELDGTMVFVSEGDWNAASNWIPEGTPTLGNKVIIRADATIPSGCVAEANRILFEGTTLTVENGGQLKVNSDITATIKKDIVGYGSDNAQTNIGFFLIAIPTTDPITAADASLLTADNNYDLFGWDRTATNEEWHNYKKDMFPLSNGMGYLYANQGNREMNITATLRRSSLPVTLTPAYDEQAGGWNLYGNPFPCEAYLSTDDEGVTFYRLIGNEFVPVTGAIAPMEGFFVVATAANQTFTISREAPANQILP